MPSKLGELLIEQNVITDEQLQKARDHQKEKGGKLGYALIKLGFVKEEEITSILSKQYAVPAINLEQFDIDDTTIKLVPPGTAQKYQVIPVNRTGATLTLAMVDPSNVFAIDDVKFMTGYNIAPVVASEIAIKEAIDKYYGSSSSVELQEIMDDFALDGEFDEDMEVIRERDEIDISALEEAGEQRPVIRLTNVVLRNALEKGASDIHMEPYENDFRIRFRIDGVLYEEMRPPMKLKDAMTARVKIMAELDISEKRLPQDGRIRVKMRIKGRVKELDLRVSSIPTVHGEKIVLRLLDKESLTLDMTQLGFEAISLEKFQENIAKPYGMVLVTGPTGSGKTTTLYSSLSNINKPETNIMTVEDPVEYNLPGINQVQMREKIGLTFASALRSFLRQDPDVVLVGEIRDYETAEIGVKAALTGHLVLSTLHTNDAPSTINRLINMGVEPFLVANSVNLICAQRLIRVTCQACKAPTDTPKQTLLDVGFSEKDLKGLTIYHGEGCNKCDSTGYKGRLGLYEVLEMTEAIQELVLCGASANEIRREAIKNGMFSLRQSGLEKVKQGLTTLDEVLRETVLQH